MTLFIDFSNAALIPWDYRQPTLICLVFAGALACFIPSLVNAYYTIDNNSFTVKRVSKEYVFTYSNIEFIDQEKSLKKKKVIFYVKGGKMQYLLSDKNNVLYETLLKKCKNLESKEEFYRAHPEEK